MLVLLAACFALVDGTSLAGVVFYYLSAVGTTLLAAGEEIFSASL